MKCKVCTNYQGKWNASASQQAIEGIEKWDRLAKVNKNDLN